MSHANGTARKEREYNLLENVVKRVNKPRIRRGQDRGLLAAEIPSKIEKFLATNRTKTSNKEERTGAS